MENETKPELEINQVVKARDCQKDLAELGDICYCKVVSIIEQDVYLAKVSMRLPVDEGLTYTCKLVYNWGGWVVLF